MREFLIQSVGVLATAMLVNSNKLVLGQLDVPSGYAALTFLHNLTTYLWVRISGRCTGLRAPEVHWGWLILITGVGSLSVVSSNLLLQLTSVTVHQLMKLASLPVGAVVDYYLYGKKRSLEELAGLLLISYGIYVASTTDKTLSLHATGVAFVFISGYLATATLVRCVCLRCHVSAAEFLYASAPWGVVSSLVWLSGGLALEKRLRHIASPPRDYDTTIASITVISNLFLAVSVQFLSTWSAKQSTTMLYAVIGQAKTAASVILSVFLFEEKLSMRSASGLSLCLVVALQLAAKEACEKGGNSTNLCGFFPRGGKVFGAVLSTFFIFGSFVSDETTLSSLIRFPE